MNPTDVPLKAPETAAIGTRTESDVTIHEVEEVERALIDASTRLPVLFFYASAIVWLLIGTFLAGLTSWKLHAPDLFANYSFLTWGRVRPAHMNVMVWGWASMAGMGTAEICTGRPPRQRAGPLPVIWIWTPRLRFTASPNG